MKTLVQLILPMALMFSSCCDNNITATNGFWLSFTNDLVVEKIELVGVGKTISANKKSVNLTLNPSDTISSYRIFYVNESNNNDTGLLTLSYKPRVSFKENDCNSENELEVVYEINSIKSSFRDVRLEKSTILFGYSNYVYITP